MRTKESVVEDIKNSRLYIWGYHFGPSDEDIQLVNELTAEYALHSKHEETVSKNDLEVLLTVWDILLCNCFKGVAEEEFIVLRGEYKNILFNTLFVRE